MIWLYLLVSFTQKRRIRLVKKCRPLHGWISDCCLIVPRLARAFIILTKYIAPICTFWGVKSIQILVWQILRSMHVTQTSLCKALPEDIRSLSPLSCWFSWVEFQLGPSKAQEPLFVVSLLKIVRYFWWMGPSEDVLHSALCFIGEAIVRTKSLLVWEHTAARNIITIICKGSAEACSMVLITILTKSVGKLLAENWFIHNCKFSDKI